MSNPYDNQVGGDHYKKYEIQPSEFINKNKLLFAEGSAIKYIVRHQDNSHQKQSGYHQTDYQIYPVTWR